MKLKWISVRLLAAAIVSGSSFPLTALQSSSEVWLQPYPAKSDYWERFSRSGNIDAVARVKPSVEVGQDAIDLMSWGDQPWGSFVPYEYLRLLFVGYDGSGISLEVRSLELSQAQSQCAQDSIGINSHVADRLLGAFLGLAGCKPRFDLNQIPGKAVRLPRQAQYNLRAPRGFSKSSVDLPLALTIAENKLLVRVLDR